MRTITARQKVVAFLRRRKSATVAQIGQALNMSAASVRHHLSILKEDGRVLAEAPVRKAKRGRPQKTFALSDRVRGENLGMLADTLLDIWLESLPAARQEAALRALAQRLADQAGPVDANLPAMKRVVHLTDGLSALHYEAGWEAGSQGPRIVFGHCPYAAIIARHPELCKMDALMLGSQMNAEALQLSKIEPGPGGATHCIFAMRERPRQAA